MTETRRLLWGAMAVALVLGAGAAEPGRAQNPGTETLTVYGAVCPVDYAGTDYFADCYDRPAAGASYRVVAQEEGIASPSVGYGVADAAGFYAFTDLDGILPGDVRLEAILADADIGPGGFTVPAARCRGADGREVPLARVESRSVGAVFRLEVEVGDDLRCDVYFVPLSLEGSGDPTIPDEAAGTDETAAPVPGRPAAIYAGGCPEDEADSGALVAELTELATPDGEAVGQAAAVVAETSFSAVPLSLDELLAGRHVIGVGSLEEDARGLVACGEVGGVLSDAGSLVIGLREVSDSGFTGIAFLAPSSADPGRTEVSVFLAAGLAQEDAAAGSTPTAR